VKSKLERGYFSYKYRQSLREYSENREDDETHNSCQNEASMPLNSPTRGVRVRTRVFAFAFVFILAGALLISCTSCRGAQSPASSGPVSTASKQPPAPLSPSSSSSLVCPTRGSTLAAEPRSANLGHRVILSWKASAPPNAKHGAAVGYCIYRGEGRRDPLPKLVNSIPFAGTRCMDDWVENGGKYTYVIRAISVRRVESGPSNLISVVIPSSKPGNSSASAISPPLCRLPTAASK
jgi:hypothetical protein